MTNPRDTEFDRSWRALFRPGDADSYFRHRPAPLRAGEEFDAGRAWWLAELSRLIYQPDAAVRADALERAGLEELHYAQIESTCYSMIKGDDVIALTFRGTRAAEDWLVNADTMLENWPAGGVVHHGFKKAFLRVEREIAAWLAGRSEPVLVTGHSLGGGLACLAASHWRSAEACYTFGQPRVGDRAFAESIPIPLYRIVNRSDMVPALPPALGYWHGGELRFLTDDDEMLVDPPKSRVYAHRLESTLNLVNPFQDAPEHLADHAAINYVRHLARHLPDQ